MKLLHVRLDDAAGTSSALVFNPETTTAILRAPAGGGSDGLEVTLVAPCGKYYLVRGQEAVSLRDHLLGLALDIGNGGRGGMVI